MFELTRNKVFQCRIKGQIIKHAMRVYTMGESLGELDSLGTRLVQQRRAATDLVGVWLCKQEVPESLHVFREAHVREIPSMDENITRRHFQGLGGPVVGICIKRPGV